MANYKLIVNNGRGGLDYHIVTPAQLAAIDLEKDYIRFESTDGVKFTYFRPELWKIEAYELEE